MPWWLGERLLNDIEATRKKSIKCQGHPLLNMHSVFARFHALCVLKWSFSLLKCYSRRWIASASCRNIRIKEFSSGSLEASWLGIAACICCVLFISHWSDLTIITDKSPLGSSTFDITYLKINNRQEYEKENYQYLRK